MVKKARSDLLKSEILRTTRPQLSPSESSDQVTPFVKVLSTQRKNAQFVTNIRKEVISLIEPFRVQVQNNAKDIRVIVKGIEELEQNIARMD